MHKQLSKMTQLIILASLLLGLAQSQLVEWEAEDYPNPMSEPEKCGRPGTEMSKVCDPNGIISQKDGKNYAFVLIFSIKVEDMYSTLPCFF